MRKEDLKYGNVVETRNGDKYVYNICYGSGYLMCLNGRGSNPLDDYDQDLIIKFNFDHEFDIVKVYKDYTLKEVLWERKEPIKLTDDEKVILRNIGKEYRYIARNSDGVLYVYEDYGDVRFNTYLNAFNHLFQFIKWEDKEPYSIEELLKRE